MNTIPSVEPQTWQPVSEGVEKYQLQSESGAYFYYPVGTEHHATSPSGCTILVWNANR